MADQIRGFALEDNEGSPSLLGASEPEGRVSGGNSLTNFFKSAADIGASIGSVYQMFKTPTQSQFTPVVRPAPDPALRESWFEQNKSMVIMGGAGAALLLIILVIFTGGRR